MLCTFLTLAGLAFSSVSGYDMLYGEAEINGWADAGGMGAKVMIQYDLARETVMISMEAPTNSWHALGMGGDVMEDRWAIVTTMDGHQMERQLGNHNPGMQVPFSTTVMEAMYDGGDMRYWKSMRDAWIMTDEGRPDSRYYQFPMVSEDQQKDPDLEIIIIIIVCKGARGDDGFEKHPAMNTRATRIRLTWACQPQDGASDRWANRCRMARTEDECVGTRKARRNCEWRC